jgi:hypothetical protein
MTSLFLDFLEESDERKTFGEEFFVGVISE